MASQDRVENISVVLLETHSGGNLGSVARAMRNMGLGRLKLVRPRHYLSEECRRLAAGAIDLLLEARLYDTLEEALADEQIVVGTTSSRNRNPGAPLQSPRRLAPRLWRHAHEQRVALLFGPERRGLSAAVLSRCRYLLSIPSQPSSPVLNLAQSVMLVAYELFQAAHPQDPPARAVATEEERQAMFRQWERVLVEIGFLNARQPEPVMRSIRRLFSRAELSSHDVRILRGIMSQVEWYREVGHRLPPQQVKKE